MLGDGSDMHKNTLCNVSNLKRHFSVKTVYQKRFKQTNYGSWFRNSEKNKKV